MSRNPVFRVVVLDMQPIEPPLGGGRIRLQGLYHNLGLPTVYIGSYDWPGEKNREIRLSPSLLEIDIPLGEKHFKACGKLLSHKRTVVDTTFPRFARFSPQYCEKAREAVEEADIIVFSHPWVFPVVSKHINRVNQLVVYDAQNVEGFLRYKLLDDSGGPGTRIVRDVVSVEGDLVHFAHLVLACSHEDARLFNRLYDLPFEKTRVVPNGVFIKDFPPISPLQKRALKKELGFAGQKIVIFLGSDYEPNLEAAHFISKQLAPQVPDLLFLIAGGVSSRMAAESGSTNLCDNVQVTGIINECAKHSLLQASDLAVNPVIFGSGSNVKMFEFMAAGLPIVTTPAGARGIEPGNDPPYWLCEKKDMAVHLTKLSGSRREMRRLSVTGYRLAERKYSWESLSKKLGGLFLRHRNKLFLKKPMFSVIVPTLERHDSLTVLMENLCQQTFSYFEIIIVDQSKQTWPDKDRSFNLDVYYIHDKIRGAARARNTAAFLARGSILAFIDDDCQPLPDWLEKATAYFDDPTIVGVEGLIRTEKIGFPGYRTVGNENFRGIGFMTANLFLRMETFIAVKGFDERFDNPHYREDTDLAWRALGYGQIPFGFDVQVFHPAHPRTEGRESFSERNGFFEKDALLLAKHPAKFKDLFLAETANKTKEYQENFIQGSKKYGITIPDFYIHYMKKHLAKQKRRKKGSVFVRKETDQK